MKVLPAVVVDIGGTPERTVQAPQIVSQTDDPATADTELLVSVATLDVPIVVDVFAKRLAVPRIVSAINADFYAQSIANGASLLCATASGLGNQPITYRRETGVTRGDTSDGAGRDEFRASLDIMAEVDELVTVSAKRFRELWLEWTVRVSNAGVGYVERRQVF